MAASPTPTVPAFGTVTRDALPKRQGPRRERTAEEIATRDALWTIVSDGATFAVDPTAYPDRKAVTNAAQRYRSLLRPLLADGQRVETSIVANDAGAFVLSLGIGTKRASKVK